MKSPYPLLSRLLALVFLLPIPIVGAAEPVPVLTVRPLTDLVFHPLHHASATAVSLNDSRLSAALAGLVVDVSVRVGQVVAKGETLARLDPWQYLNQARQAKAGLAVLRAQLRLARSQHQRALLLKKQGQATEERLDQRKTEVETLLARIRQQQAVLDAARTQIAQCTVKAPFAGVVAERLVQVGIWTNPGQTLVRLVDLQNLVLSVQVGPEATGHLARGRAPVFQHQGVAYPVRLQILLPVENPGSRVREARFLFPGAKPIPGAAGRLAWRDPRPHIPAWLPVRRKGQWGVFLAREGKAVFYPLSHAVEGRPVPLLTPLSGNALLSGREGLTDGATVRPVPDVP